MNNRLQARLSGIGGFRTLVAAVAVAMAGASSASAQTATQTVTFQVTAINQIGVTGAPSLIVNTAVPGNPPSSATSAGNTWAVTCNQTGAKVTASIPSAMPVGLTLSANLAAPAGGTSAGLVALGVVATDMVTGITKLNASSLGLTYQLDATTAAGVVASSTRVVTYTLTGGT